MCIVWIKEWYIALQQSFLDTYFNLIRDRNLNFILDTPAIHVIKIELVCLYMSAHNFRLSDTDLPTESRWLPPWKVWFARICVCYLKLFPTIDTLFSVAAKKFRRKTHRICLRNLYIISFIFVVNIKTINCVNY